MREYAKVAPTFWTGKTGKDIKRRGIEGVVMATYLMSSPHSNMLGLFYQPILYFTERLLKNLTHAVTSHMVLCANAHWSKSEPLL